MSPKLIRRISANEKGEVRLLGPPLSRETCSRRQSLSDLDYLTLCAVSSKE